MSVINQAKSHRLVIDISYLLFLAKVQMIEADIVYGTLFNDSTNELQPIMAHPPNVTSDISLKSFLIQIMDFNNATTKEKQKGVKLDFKSTDVFENSLPMLIDLWITMNYPVWINADIYRGPLNNLNTTPVDAQIFFKGTKNLHNATLSTGWTTRWGSNFTDGVYTNEQVNEMIKGIKASNVVNPITFPVRAGIAAQSIPQLDHLYKSLNKTNHITFTIWSSNGDNVNVKKLREMILHFGVDKVYVDVPEELSEKLQLNIDPIAAGHILQSNLFIGLMIVFGLILLFW